MAAIFQIRRGDSSYTSSLVNGELYLNTNENSLQVGTSMSGTPIKLLSLNQPNTGSLKLYGDISASNLYVTGNVRIDGKITVGNETGDTLNIVASLSSSLIPSDHKSFDIGSSNKWYKNLYVETISSSFISGTIAGIGNIEQFSQSVDSRLDFLEGPFSTSVDGRMDLLENAMSGSNRLYVSPEGNDTNNGTQQNPFKTIKAAVESLGAAVYTNTKRYTIFVGSGNYTEQNPIAVPPGVAIVGDTLRTVRLTAANPTKDYFHCHDSNYFYGLRFLNLQNPAFCFSYPASIASSTISGGSVATISVIHSMTGYTDGNNQDIGIIIEGPDDGITATATANVAGGVITQINVTNGGTNYGATEKPHISIPAPLSKRPVIGTSPYIQNCSSITGPFTTDGTLLSLIPGNVNYAPLPYNVLDVRNQSGNLIGSGIIDEQGAGGGIRIDGNLVHPLSPLESFVADAFTQVNQGGPGHLVINKGYAQFVSCFTTFCTYGFKTANGGFANISNSVIDFGAKGLISKTYFPQTYNTGSSLETKTSQVSGFVIDENGAGYTGSVANVLISGGGASVNATAQANVNANGSIDEIVLLTPGSGYTSQPTVTIAPPTGPGAIQAGTVAGKALISGVSEILMSLESGSRGVDISSNMILDGVDYLVTDVATVGGQPNQRRVTTYPAPPSIDTNDQIYFHQLSNISTGGLVMEYVGSGVTYNALPKYGGVPIRTREINEVAPGRVFYSTVDNIGNLKIGDFFAVNQLTGEVTIDANSFNLSGLNAIGPFRRNSVAVGVVLQEVSNNTTLLNSQGLYGEDTVPTQYAVKEYVQAINTSLDGRLDKLEIASASLNDFTQSANSRLTNLEITSASVNISVTNLNSTTASLNVSVSNLNSFSGSQLDKDTTLGAYTASVEGRFSTLGSLSGSFARTNSANTFNGNQIVSGSLTVTQDLIILGSSSITNVSSSTLNIGTNLITVAVNQPSVRFGGLSVMDSGSAGASGSFLYDSVQDEFIFVHKGNGTNVTSSHFLLGPETFDNLGNEIYLTNNRLPKGTGKEHLNDSNITDTGTLITLGSNTVINGTLVASGTPLVSGSAQISGTGITNNTITIAGISTALGGSITAATILNGTNVISSSAQITSVLPSGVVSGSSQVIGILSSLNTFSGSQLTQNSTLATYTGSVDGRFSTLATYTGSVDGKFSILATYTGSVDGRFSTLATLTGSYNTRLTEIGIVTGSLIASASATSQSVWHLHQFSASENGKAATLATYTGSVDGKFTSLATISGSLILSASAVSSSVWHLHQFSASVTASLIRMTASIVDHEERIEYIEGINGISGGNPLTQLHIFSASAKISIANLEAATSSYETKGRGIVSGSSQIVPLLPTGVISGSIQVLGGSGVWSGSSQLPAGVVSGSLQVIGILSSLNTFSGSTLTRLTALEVETANLESFTSSINTTIKTRLNAETVISGSSQILGGSTIHSSSVGDYQFNSIGVGTAASTTSGEIRATGDITAYYSSDIRLKENITPIESALQKVELISGNTYDWKEGYDEVHSHKGNDVGVIAQEIEAVLPQIVTNRDNGYKAVQYEKIIPLLIEAIKELSAKVDRLENK